MDRKIIIVSAINFHEGGPLKVMQECLSFLSGYKPHEYKVIALVHNDNLYDKSLNVEYINFPKSRSSWFYRLYYEYWYFNKLSRKYNVYCWFSLHDISPNVKARIRAVYCHNPSPFYKAELKDFRLERSFYLFSLFYKWLYRINIRKDNYVVVQQEWIRACFERMYHIRNVVVALPAPRSETVVNEVKKEENDGVVRFFYPSLARVFKNFELIGDAVEILEKQGVSNLKVYVTIDGSENKYSAYIYEKYKHLKSMVFIGIQKREQVNEYYQKCDCILFPSKLETWGLPISEAKSFGKPILLANLPYAKETVGKYDRVIFIDPADPYKLAQEMTLFMSGMIAYDKTEEIVYKKPFSDSWEKLFGIILDGKTT